MTVWDDNPIHVYVHHTRWRVGQWGAIACIPAVATILTCASGIVLSRGLIELHPDTLFLGVAIVSFAATQAAFLISTPDILAAACREKTMPHLALTGLSPEGWLGGHVFAFMVDWLTAVAMHGPLFGMMIWAGYTTTGNLIWVCLLIGLATLNLLLLRLSYWRMELTHWIAVAAFAALAWGAAGIVYGMNIAMGAGTFMDVVRFWAGLCPVMGILSLHPDAFVAEAPDLGRMLSRTLTIGPRRLAAGSPVVCLVANGLLTLYLLGCILLGPRRELLAGTPGVSSGASSQRHRPRDRCPSSAAKRLFQENARPFFRMHGNEIALMWSLAWLLAAGAFIAWVGASGHAAHGDAMQEEYGHPFIALIVCLTIAVAAGPASCFRSVTGDGFSGRAIRRHMFFSLLLGGCISVLAAAGAWFVMSGRQAWFGSIPASTDAAATAFLVLISGLAATALGALISSAVTRASLARIATLIAVALWCAVPLWVGAIHSAGPTAMSPEDIRRDGGGIQILSLSPWWQAGAAIRHGTSTRAAEDYWIANIGAMPLAGDGQLAQSGLFLALCMSLIVLAGLAVGYRLRRQTHRRHEGGEDL